MYLFAVFDRQNSIELDIMKFARNRTQIIANFRYSKLLKCPIPKAIYYSLQIWLLFLEIAQTPPHNLYMSSSKHLLKEGKRGYR